MLQLSWNKSWTMYTREWFSDVLWSGLWTVVLSKPCIHDTVIKWKHFPRYRPLVREIHRSPANSPHKGQWRGALMFSLICAWINSWLNNHVASDLGRHRAYYDVIVMCYRDGVISQINVWLQGSPSNFTTDNTLMPINYRARNRDLL